MPADERLLERSTELKQALVHFVLGPRFDRVRDRAEAAYLGPSRKPTEATRINFLDFFALQYRLSDGRTPLEWFVATQPSLPEADRELLLGWREVVEGVFEIVTRAPDALATRNVIDELDYVVRSNAGRPALRDFRSGDFLIGRVVPLADEWLLSGVSQRWPASSRAAALKFAADLAAQHPRLVLRNPAKLAQAWELQRAERRHFIEFFGTDLIIVPGHDVAERLRAFGRYCTFEARGADGKTPAERVQAEGGAVPTVPEHQLPDSLSAALTVGIVFDEVDGLLFLSNFGQVEQAFAQPEALSEDERRAALDYLEDESISPRVIQRLAERDTDRATALVRRVLDRRTFSWERDGDSLLHEYKANYYAQPVLPGITPLSTELAQAYVQPLATGEHRPATRPRSFAAGQRSRRRRR